MVHRPLPEVTERTAPFWRGGADGELRFQRCATCARLHHPPGPVCPYCYGDSLAWTRVSGAGTIYSLTVNHQPWFSGDDVPYVVATITIAEQDDIRLVTNILGPSAREAASGARLHV